MEKAAIRIIVFLGHSLLLMLGLNILLRAYFPQALQIGYLNAMIVMVLAEILGYAARSTKID